jgi:hypothetical protein
MMPVPMTVSTRAMAHARVRSYIEYSPTFHMEYSPTFMGCILGIAAPFA